MTPSNSDEFDPEARDQREIGREMVEQSTGLGLVMAHFYRGEMDRETTWRQRLDESTKWAVTVIAAIHTYAFASSGTSHAVLLAGIVIVAVFLGIEAHRVVVAVTFWPHPRYAKGEFSEVDPGEWK